MNVSHEYTFAVDVPQGYVKQHATSWLSDGRGSHVWGELHVRTASRPPDTTLDRFAQSVRNNVQQEWMTRWPSAPLFQITSFEKRRTGDRALYHLKYRVRESERYCILDVEEVLGVGGAPPGPVQSFRVQHWSCEELAFGPARRQILSSFRIVAQPPAYYTQYLDAGGIWVKAAAKVDPRALHAAAEKINLMLAHIRTDFPPCLSKTGAALAIIPKDEPVTTLPEFAHLKGKRVPGGTLLYDAIRGLGAVKGQPVSATSEEDVLDLPGISYPDIDVTIHEYAHSIMNLCFNQADHEIIDSLYASAQQAGLFPGEHVMLNSEEFFAVLSDVYFNTNSELSRYGLSGSQGRKDLQNLLPAVFAFMERIYNAQ